jgi:hypothetical protein
MREEENDNYMVCVDTELFNSVISYLLDRPAREVHKLLRDLENVKMVDVALYARMVDDQTHSAKVNDESEKIDDE